MLMADIRYVSCRCPDSAESLGWSYSTDDLYCPGCGFPVSRLVSDNQFPSRSGNSPLWVYPGGNDARFVVPLLLEFADSERQIRNRRPRINFAEASVADNRYFHATETDLALDIGREQASADALQCRLLPATSNKEFRLPDSGIEYRVDGLEGDCSERSLVFRAGNRPSVRIELSGAEIESDVQTGGFTVSVSEKLKVTLHVHAIDAPILVEKTVDREVVTCRLDNFSSEHTQVQFILLTPLEAGKIITPGTPWTGQAEFDTSTLTEGQSVTLKVPVKSHVTRTNRGDWQIKVVRVDKGGLEITPDPLTIPVMYFGEHLSNAITDRVQNPEGSNSANSPLVVGRVFVKNRGKSSVTLGEITTLSAADWIKAAWSRDGAQGSKRAHTDSQLELASEERGEIYISIDLRNISTDQLEEGRSLSATLRFKESGNPEVHQTRIVINQIKPREPSPFPLCIDFGNTSSFAAIRNPNNIDTPWLKGEVIAAHDRSSPDFFPTALFIHRVSKKHILDSEYEIGSAAITEMEKRTSSNSGYGAFVRDLKRWIGSEEHAKSVIDLHGNHQVYDVKSLIIMYLARLIERAEAILRRYNIEELCVSHPSKYSMARREAFCEILDNLCKEVTQNRQIPLRLVSDDNVDEAKNRDIDEANAVAVGAVFDDEIRNTLYTIVSPKRSSFTIASFDLGGGSLDTALIRFDVRKGLIATPRYTTKYLGIGGNDEFGGDDVTFVVFELLKQRIKRALERAGLPADTCLSCIPSPIEKDREDPERRRNYEVLWDVAERIKIFRCTNPNPDHASPIPNHPKGDGQSGILVPINTTTLAPKTNTNDINSVADNTDSTAAASGKGHQPDYQPSNSPDDQLKVLRHFVHTRLVNDLVLDPSPGGSLSTDPRCTDAIMQLVKSYEFLVDLDEIYSYEVNDDLSGTLDSWTVRGRLSECIDEIVKFADANDETIDLVIRCGSGSQLPLVEQMFRKRRDTDQIPALRNAKILPKQPDQNSKRRVAHGLVQFLEATRQVRHKFAQSSDYASSAFALGNYEDIRSGVIKLIPNCASVDAKDTWYSPRSVITLEDGVQVENLMTLDDLGSFANEIVLYRIDRGRSPKKHGWFDVTQPPADSAGGEGLALSNQQIESIDPNAAVRIAGSERHFELKLETEDACLGIWKIIFD